MRAAFCIAFFTAASAIGCGPSFRLGFVSNNLSLASSLHKHDEAVTLAAEYVSLTGQVYSPNSVEMRDALRRQARMLADADRGPEALSCMRRAMELDVTLHGAGDQRTSLGYRVLADIHFGMGSHQETRSAIHQAIRICDAVPRSERLQFACDDGADWSCSRTLRDLGDYEASERLLLAYRAEPRPPEPLVSQSTGIANLAEFYFEYGNYENALLHYADSVRLWREGTGRDGSWDGVVYKTADIELSIGNDAHEFPGVAPNGIENLVRLLCRANRAEQARSLEAEEAALWAQAPNYEETLKEKIRFTKGTWPQPGNMCRDWRALGFYYWKKRDLGAAIHAYETAARFAEEDTALLSQYERRTPILDTFDVHLTLGDIYVEAGRYAEAEPQYRRVLDEVDRYLNPRHRWRIDLRERLAQMYAKAGDLPRARAAWNDYLAFTAKARGKSHAEYAWGLSNLADVERRTGNNAEAERLQRTALAIWREYGKTLGTDAAALAVATLKPNAPATK